MRPDAVGPVPVPGASSETQGQVRVEICLMEPLDKLAEIERLATLPQSSSQK
jgi:hypothetical protein